MSPQVLSRYETALHATDPLPALRAAVKERLARETKDGVLAELEELRLRLQADKHEDLEDVVLDVMDAVTGFSSQSAKIA